MKNKLLKYLVVLFFLCLLSSCQTTHTPTPAASLPVKGKATVVGVLVSQDTNKPYDGVLVRLAAVINQGDQGAYVLDSAHSPGATTDKDGHFRFENINAMKYVFVIGDPTYSYVIISGPDGKAKVWDAPADKVTDFGTIKANYVP